MKHSFTFIALISLFLVACNKDEDIIIENPILEPELGFTVIEYTPAPGQYINEVSNGSAVISSAREACEYAESRFAESQYVSLGAWGGYIVIKFDESISNSGDYDFLIGSNAFDTSNEPGIVWVMEDTNGNGLPDEEWFELKGSFFGEEGYERNYWVTYFRPAEADEDTKWEDSNGETGSVKWMGQYHSQPFYYPSWITDNSITFNGSRLPSQAYQNPDTGIWSNLPFEWGYADNFGVDFIQEGNKNSFRISDAITSENQPANLSKIDFVKVQTAINSSSGGLGELSTEVTGFYTY